MQIGGTLAYLERYAVGWAILTHQIHIREASSGFRWLVLLVSLVTSVAAPTAHPAVLSADPADNQDLSPGNYYFLKYHDPFDGSFEDSWGFSLTQQSRVRLVANTIDFHIWNFEILDIDNFRVMAHFNDERTLSSGEWLDAVLSPGSYEFDVAGTVDGIFGGKYGGKLDISAVPLPSALLMFGSALLLLMTLKWRGGRAAALP